MNLRLNKNIVIAFILTLLIGLYIIYFFPTKNKYIYVNSLENNLGSITNSFLVEQTFYSSEDNLSAIGIVFGKYMKNSNSKVYFILRCDEEIKSEKIIDASDLLESKYYYFKFNPIENSNGKNVRISIQVKGENENEDVTIYNSHDDQYEYGSAIINGEIQQFDLSFAAKYSMSKKEAVEKVLQQINIKKTVVVGFLFFNVLTFISIATLVSKIVLSNKE